MGEDLLASLSMDNQQHPSTVLSMDSSSIFNLDLSKEMNTSVMLTGPPDINLPLSTESCASPQLWSQEIFGMDVGLGNQSGNTESDGFINNLPKKVRTSAKGLDSAWGAWFFFSYYFKPVFVDKSKSKVVRDGDGFYVIDKANLNLDVFLVQHDMENMYMWVFKDGPVNALGLMKLRNYMNGNSRQGQRPFPFSVDKGFLRSHRMQRKHYRGLSNPQCIHGIELVQSPNLKELDQEEQKRWMELTGRHLNFFITAEASEYSSWRNLPNTDFELEHPLPLLMTNSNVHSKKVFNGSNLNLSTQISNLTTLSAQLSGITNGGGIDISHVGNKRKKDSFLNVNDEDCCIHTNNLNYRGQDIEMHPIEAPWINAFGGVMKDAYGPVTAAKTIYEDEQGYLIIVSLPFSDLKRVKVTWWNNLTHGVVKISCVSTTCMRLIKRNDRTFKLTDPSPEHCPPGEFVREVPLPTRIPDDAKLEAYEDETGTGLEILVPKHRVGPEEHEVVVCLRPHLGSNEL